MKNLTVGRKSVQIMEQVPQYMRMKNRAARSYLNVNKNKNDSSVETSIPNTTPV